MTQHKNTDIAIIGMGCIFPGSVNLKAYWHLLFNGVDAIQEIPADTHWPIDNYFDSDPSRPDHVYCSRGGFIPKINFDPTSFGIPPNNITATDTAQLLGLLVAKMALEDAGYPKDHPFLSTAKVNVILGVTGTQELVIPLGARLGFPFWEHALDAAGVSEKQKDAVCQQMRSSYVSWQENSFPGLLGNVVAGRIANRFNLSGTNSVSDAACASSLSALHSAVMELAAGKCDMSITGGVDCLNDIFMHMCFAKTGVLSHTSDARPFSKDADGTVLGEGIGMLVLKRLTDAKKTGDRIYAIIKGVGTSSDGKTSAIYAPDAKGQLKALNDAYDQAGIDPVSVGLVEAHGTGTRVGDKVEFSALKTCFKSRLPSHESAARDIAIGSVKSMIGHTKAAAGAAGIIKAALALHHKVIPPTLKADEPDPDLDINQSCFYLNQRSSPWVAPVKDPVPRRAGVSAFGFGGSNFHVILEEHTPEKDHISWDGSVQIAAFSARDTDALIKNLKAFKKGLIPDFPADEQEMQHLIDGACAVSRNTFNPGDPYRVLMVLNKTDDPAALAETACDSIQQNRSVTGPVYYDSGPKPGKLGFLFPGQGSQYPDMGKDLFAVFPEAMAVLKQAQHIFSAHPPDILDPEMPDSDLAALMFPPPPHRQAKPVSEARLRHTRAAQMAIGTLSLAMIRVLKRFNVSPHMTCGHSFGELSALYAAGWMDDTTLLTLAAVRGKLMAQAGGTGSDTGGMLAVQAPLTDIETWIKDRFSDLVLANRNSPDQGVLSGPTPAVDQAAKWCRKNKVRCVKLPVAAAFHSPLVADAATPFHRFVAEQHFSPTGIPVLSNTTGTVYDTTPETVKSLLGHQLMHPVCFKQNIETMYDHGVCFFMEVGPKTVLTGLTGKILAATRVTTVSLDASGGKKSGITDLAHALCHLAAKGFDVDLTPWEDPVPPPSSKRMRIPLSGANPKPEIKQSPPVPASHNHAPGTGCRTSGIDVLSRSCSERHTHTPGPETEPSHSQGPDMRPLPSPQTAPKQAADTVSSHSTADMKNAMHLVHKGLEAMQALQAQTAQAHEKFLETQAQASRTLAAMMSQTRQFVDGVAPVTEPSFLPAENLLPARPVPSRSIAAEPPAPAKPETAPRPDPQALPAKVNGDTPQIKGSVTTPSKPERPADQPTDEVQAILFEIVGRLTGFPEEMLEPEMDIESDLGVDSIKKVEIVSELEKQLPDTRGLTAENMGTARTLADICRAVAPAGTHAADPVAHPLPEVAAIDASRPEPGAAGTADSDPAGASGVMDVLVKTISELTGFPETMLEPAMDLESDLGVDSIKRVEILSRLEQAMGDNAPGLSGDDMARVKTIRDMVKFLDQSDRRPGAGVKKNTSHRADDPGVTEKPDLIRQTLYLKKIPIQQVRFFNGSRIQLPDSGKIYITRDQAGIGQSLKQAFHKQGLNAVILDPASGKIPDLPDMAGLVILQDQLSHPDTTRAIAFLKTAFALIHQNGAYLQAAGTQKGSFLATVTFSGGGFGIPPFRFGTLPEYGGLAGMVKTAALEWKEVLCHALDLPEDIKACQNFSETAAALMMTRGPIEMGLDKDHCQVPTLAAKPVEPGHLALDSRDVAVITGGARGVTAACADKLAETAKLRIVLLGRSPKPFKDPEWARSVSAPAQLKKAILMHEFAGKKPTPADLEKRYQAICANRQIHQTLSRIRSHGSEVIYRSTDIRNPEAVRTTLDEIRRHFNAPVTAIIHGAGVLEDKWIVDKHPDRFDRVFDTKVDGLNALLEATQKDPLKYVIVFSSIAARTGNPGQCDYAMANEVLNKHMDRIARQRPDCKCLAVNWGPWDGGMVHDGLKQMFAQKGVGLIPVSEGARHLIREMAGPDQTHKEVVITAPGPDLKQKKPARLSPVLQMEISRKTLPILSAHQINHEPVMPFALMAEIMAQTAEKNHPGLVVAGLDDFRLLKGIRPGDGAVLLDVNQGRCACTEKRYMVPLSLSSMPETGPPSTHATASAILRDHLPEPPVLSDWNRMDLGPCRLTIRQAYDTVLFHGRDLQAITAITGISDKGIEVTALPAPAPDLWFKTPSQSHWTMDPLLLDAAFQAAILWTWETRKQVCLPAFVAGLRIYSSFRQPPDADAGIRILFTVNENTDHQIKGYFTFTNARGHVVASVMGFEAVVDDTLHARFKPRPLFDRQSILAFSQGNPSEAFGARYDIFDTDRRIARLPRPPYFFMDRVVTADHAPWEMQPGGWIETQYDVPEDAWYFAANRTRTMPLCILLEIALQPCGWLAAYAGSALHSDNRLYFRNLGGTARWMDSVFQDAGTLTVRVRMTDVSKAGGMILQSFDMAVTLHGQPIYEGTTHFGFFTGPALSGQKGIRNCTLAVDPSSLNHTPQKVFEKIAPLTPADDSIGPDTGMPADALRMIDSIEILDPSGGNFKKGYVRAEKTVDPKQWFFDAHFYQDPVCPGSLGIESFLQTLRYYLLTTFSIDPATHTPMVLPGESQEWIYRGQIIPSNRKVVVHTHIREVSQEDGTCSVVADGALCVDGRPIYEMKNFGLAFVPAGMERNTD
ncbi:MAG: SDR family NAD(P)-dependent oxidoreductase [Desulfotignum sp.]